MEAGRQQRLNCYPLHTCALSPCPSPSLPRSLSLSLCLSVSLRLSAGSFHYHVKASKLGVLWVCLLLCLLARRCMSSWAYPTAAHGTACLRAGLVLASILVPLIGFASIWCSFLLLKVRLTTESQAGYGDLMSNAMGPKGRAASNLFIVLLQLGMCCTYFIVACKLLQTTLCPHVDLNTLIAIMAVGMVPLVAVRKARVSTKSWALDRPQIVVGPKS